MSRKYWLDISIRVADGEDNSDNAGYASGGRIDINWTDDALRSILKIDTDFIMDTIIPRLREEEAKRDREAAAPFWRKWLGGV
jgi:hypothetical protein